MPCAKEQGFACFHCFQHCAMFPTAQVMSLERIVDPMRAMWACDHVGHADPHAGAQACMGSGRAQGCLELHGEE